MRLLYLIVNHLSIYFIHLNQSHIIPLFPIFLCILFKYPLSVFVHYYHIICSIFCDICSLLSHFILSFVYTCVFSHFTHSNMWNSFINTAKIRMVFLTNAQHPTISADFSQLVHRFVNNYTNRIGCGFEYAEKLQISF